MRQCICVFLVYKGPKVKFSSVCRAEQMVNIGPIVGDIPNCYIELLVLNCSLEDAFSPKKKSRQGEKLSWGPDEQRGPRFFILVGHD